MKTVAALLMLGFILPSAVQAQRVRCPARPSRPVRFKQNSCSFSATPQEQAKCLLRKVRPYGELDARPLEQLPPPLDSLIGQTVSISKEALRQYLAGKGISETDLGGSLDQPLSKSRAGEAARYFIIHDTSSLLPGSAFPANINDASWPGNRFNGFLHPKNRDGTPARVVAHVFVNRLGQSATGVNFNTAWFTTKYEVENRADRLGLFIGIEMIQPRLNDRRGIDAIAPEPGFPDGQLDRLALVYTAASVRAGKWMIPVFHAAVDEGLCNAHDDPQNFDLSLWATRLRGILTELGVNLGGI
jgi:hypothetical protein